MREECVIQRENDNVTSMQTLTTQKQGNNYVHIRVIKMFMMLPVEEQLIKYGGFGSMSATKIGKSVIIRKLFL